MWDLYAEPLKTDSVAYKLLKLHVGLYLLFNMSDLNVNELDQWSMWYIYHNHAEAGIL